MHDIELLIAARNENWERVRRSGRALDEEFIRQGFSAVQAEIEFIGRVYGPSAYAANLSIHSSEEAFGNFRGLELEVDQRLHNLKSASPQERDALWDAVMTDDRLPSFLKSNALFAIDQERLEARLAANVPAMLAALEEEQIKACKLEWADHDSLSYQQAVPLRKQIINESMSDAFGALGFEVYRRIKGVHSYVKRLTDKHAIYVEPDVSSIERRYAPLPRLDTIYLPSMTWDKVISLGTTGKSAKRLLTFNPFLSCCAAWKVKRYEDARSLEVSVRASALWYQLTTAPIEKVAMQLT